MRFDIVPGAVFPNYELSDHTAKRWLLSELQGQDPMVLVLGRGGYCPKDRRQAELLVQLHRELEVAYCRLVTISTDNITETAEYLSGVGAHWPFLSDADASSKGSRHRRIHRSCAQSHDPARDCPRAGALSFTRSITATGSSAGPPWRISGRTCVQYLRNAGRTGTSRTPEMKTAWQQGHKELFYPYGKTFVQTLGEQD